MTHQTKPHYDWKLKRLARWKRRAMTIPAVLIGVPILVLVSPLLLVAALIADLAEGFKKRRWLRVLTFAMTFAVTEFFTILVGIVTWVLFGFGLGFHTDFAQKVHRGVKITWCRWQLRVIQTVMSTKITFHDAEVGKPGPALAMARHTSMGDAFIPMVVMGGINELALRVVLKDDLIWLPSIDIFGHRLPNHFVDRNPANREAELEPIVTIAKGIDKDSAGVIFPEGTFRTSKRFDRAIASITKTNPERAERVAGLKHLLPFRPGGTLAYLEGSPDADMVFIAHTGFEKFRSFKEIIANVPFEHDVPVKTWRVPRSEVPTEPDAQLEWLDEKWQRVDDWVEEQVSQRSTR